MNPALEDDILAALSEILDSAPVPTRRSVAPAVVPIEPRARPRRWPIMLVAASLVGVTVSGAIVMDRRQPSDKVRTGPPSSTRSETSAPKPTSATTVAPSQGLSSYRGWYWPSYTPAGFELADIDVYNGVNATASPANRWVRLDASGKAVAGLVAQTSIPAPQDPGKASHYNATVHGIQASSFDSGEGIVVSWQEGTHVVSVRGLALSQHETLLAAESTVVDATTGTVTLKAGTTFTTLPRVSIPTNGVGITADLVRSDNATGFITFSSTPNAEGLTVPFLKLQAEASQQKNLTIERHGTIDRLVQRPPASPSGALAQVTWLQDDMVMSVSGRIAADEVIKVAESIQTVEPQRLIDEGHQITKRLLARPTLDRVAFTDGLTLSVKTRGGAAIGLCAEAPETVCRWHLDESSLAGDHPNVLFDTFDIGGHVVVLGWSVNVETPTLTPPAATTANGDAPKSTATLTESKQTGSGQFIEIAVPDGEQPPTITFGTTTFAAGTRADTNLIRF